MESLAKDPLLTKGSLDDKVGATPTAGSFGLKKDGIFIEEKDKKIRIVEYYSLKTLLSKY